MASHETVSLLIQLSKKLKLRDQSEQADYFLSLSKEDPDGNEFIERVLGIGKMSAFFDFTKDEEDIIDKIYDTMSST